MTTNLWSLFITGCSLLLLGGCSKSDELGFYTHNGIQYHKSTGLNAESTAMYDARDGAIYPVISIGNQLWMTENLRYEVEGAQWNPQNPTKEYGCLYNWKTVINVCPKGWHLPSDADWQELEKAIGMQEGDLPKVGWRPLKAVNKLKSTSGWTRTNNGSNQIGLNIFPAGRYEAGAFKNMGNYAFFWTSTLKNKTEAIGRYFYHEYAKISRTYVDKSVGQSCRCILD